LLVTSLAAFEKYQRESAWTWEHQALVRARPVAGDMALKPAFDRIRHQVLAVRRDEHKLRTDVIDMREKMRAHLGSPAALSGQQFHLKQDRGGIVDIEFIAQYIVLLHAADHPPLITYTDNMRILDAVESLALLGGEDSQNLRDAYIFYRSLGHRLNLQGRPGVIEESHSDWQRTTACRAQVTAIWQKIFL
jgi:glutamate-ammonia-ligase adenylyltransferase